MALTESTMLPLGSEAPDFTLPEADGGAVTLSEIDGASAYLVMFICNHCPYVKHVAPELARLGKEYLDLGVAVMAIQSNDAAAYPDDAPVKMAEEKKKQGYTFPYLYDETQDVAKAYTAACTPDFFLFNGDHKLVYRGQLDDTRPARIESGVYDSTGNEANGADLRAAVAAVLAGKPVTADQKPSAGCNIKWKPGNEPDYFK